MADTPQDPPRQSEPDTGTGAGTRLAASPEKGGEATTGDRKLAGLQGISVRAVAERPMKEVRGRIDSAARTIDAPAPEGGRRDYLLEPLDHAKLYAQSAPELAERLRGSDLRMSAESYVKRDAEANVLRAEFEKKSRRARTAVLAATIAAALLVSSAGAAAIPGLPADLLASAVILLSLIAVIAAALAGAWIQSIRGSALLERWMKRRAEAESERARYFTLIADETRLEEPLLQLEYIRRYQLDVQRAFFDRRGEDHRRGADRQIVVISAATAAAGIATGIAGVLGASLHPSWTSLAAIGLVAQAFSARAENRIATEQSLRHAERYDQTRLALDEIYRLLDRVRLSTAALDADEEPAVMREYVAAIHERLALEHRQWLDDTQLASEAVARLELMIEDSQRKLKER
jgi:hypothetical protein